MRTRGGRLWLEVGAGPRRGTDGWTTLDAQEGCDLPWDLRRGLPFPDGSAERIYSSHFLEHLDHEQGQAFLGECRRVLRPGGTFSLAVPNARIYLEAYARPEAFDRDRFLRHAPAVKSSARIDVVGYIAYMDGHHHNLFDEEKLLLFLEAGGLRNARLRDFDPGLDRAERDYESIYAVAER